MYLSLHKTYSSTLNVFFKVISGFLILISTQAQVTNLEDFETNDGWNFIKSDGVNLNLNNEQGRTGNALRFDYDFTKGTGYGGFQKNISIDLPENYEITFWVKADSPANSFEIKFLDTSGDNVWWVNNRNYTFPTEWTKIKIKKRHISFAWGPNNNPKPPRIDRIEFTIASFVGGKGTLWIDDLKFEPLPAETDVYPKPTASLDPVQKSKTLPKLFDGSQAAYWKSKNADSQSLIVDFKTRREFGGVFIDWAANESAKSFEILLSNDRVTWEKVCSVRENLNDKSIIRLPEAEAKYLKLNLIQSNSKKRFAIDEIKFLNFKESQTLNKFFIYNAHNADKGNYPRYFLEQASFFTISGVNNDTKEAMINTDGMVEVDKAAFSLEPMLMIDKSLYNWANVASIQNMGDSTETSQFKFIPNVQWNLKDLTFKTEITSGGIANTDSHLYIKYTFENLSLQNKNFDFLLLVRPFQVNPYYQDLNLIGGVGKINNIQQLDNQTVQVDDKWVFSELPFQMLSTYTTSEGDVVALIKNQKLNARKAINDATGLATGVMKYALQIKPKEKLTFYIKVPYHPQGQAAGDQKNLAGEFNQSVDFWNDKIDHIKFNLPASADRIINTYKSNLVYILTNRDKAGIQPGSRSYERSWIRDGSLTSSALLKSGIVTEVKDYINWYSDYLYDNGKVPCVVDKRGPDPVPENDSHGQFIYLIKEYYNFTHDVAFLESKNEKVIMAVDYIEELMMQRMVEPYKSSANDSIRALYGLMPESISHEGYSAKPMHSYWDDFFVMKGLKDAVEIQKILGETLLEKRMSELRDTFKTNLYNSINLSMQNKGINYIPGCSELGDFDATSTTVALTPCNEFNNLPKPEIFNTFDKYYDFFIKRRENTISWNNYTPYENRVIGSFIMLNQPDKAHDLIDFFLKDQKPQNWYHWAEVVWKDDTYPGYIGDMPHTWVGSDFLNAIRSMFVYENEWDKSLVLGAALYQDWIDAPQGMSVENLPTYFGEISYAIQKDQNKYVFKIWGDVKLPENGIKIQNFNASKMPSKVLLNGESISTFSENVIQIQKFPAQVEIFY
jgi:hypothetical protein